jgi:WD40 repeat protein
MGFTPSGQLAIRFADPRSKDATLGVFDVATGKTVTSVAIKGGGDVRNNRPACAIAPGGEWIAYGEGPNLRFLALPPAKPALPGRGAIKVVSWEIKESPDVWLDDKGETAFVYQNQANLPTLERWNLAKQSSESVVQTPQERAILYAVTLNPPARRMAVSAKLFDEDNPWIESWSLADKLARVTIETKVRAWSLAYSPDGKTLAAGFMDGSVAWYDAATGKTSKPILRLGKLTVGSVAFHPGGKHLACGTNDRGMPNLFMVDIISGQIMAKMLADPNAVTAVCFNASGNRLAVFGSSGTVTIWDADKLLKLERD